MSQVAVHHADLPATGFVRLSQLVLDSRKPGKGAPLPFSKATLWRMVNAGKFPAPVKLSERITAWRVEEVREWIATHAADVREAA